MALNRRYFVLLLIVCLLGIFWLPYHVPTQPSVSDSYIFGFNNRVAWLCFLAYVAVAVCFGPQIATYEHQGGSLGRATLYKALAGTLLSSLAMYLLMRPYSGYGEADYLTDRIRLALQGRVLYRDIEYPYGPAFVYLPVAIVRSLHVNVRDAYGIFYVLICLLGTYLLWVSMNWVDGPARFRRVTFLFIWAASLLSTLNYGLNYTLTRFIVPIYLVLLVHRVALRKGASHFAPFAIALLGYVLMLAISPELAIALVAGSLLYLVLLGHLRSERNMLPCAVTTALVLLLSSLAFKLGILRTMLAIRVGALNFPVLPALHVWLFLIAAGVTACVVGSLWRSGHTGSALALLCYALPASASALGRCDGGHLLLNGLPFFICAIIATSGMRLPWRGFLWVAWFAYLLPFVIRAPALAQLFSRSFVPAVLSWEPHDRMTSLDKWLLRHDQQKYGFADGSAKFATDRTTAHSPAHLDIARIYHQAPGTIFQIPYGFGVDGYGRYTDPALDSGYFLMLADIGTPRQVQMKIDELREHPERPLLLPPGSERPCIISVATEWYTISHLFLFPFHAKPVHQENLFTPLCTYVQQNYRRATPEDAAYLHYVLWLPKRMSTAGNT